MASKNFRSIIFLIDRYKRANIASFNGCLTNHSSYTNRHNGISIKFRTYFSDYKNYAPRLDLVLSKPTKVYSHGVSKYKKVSLLCTIKIRHNNIECYLNGIYSKSLYSKICKCVVYNNSTKEFFKKLMESLRNNAGGKKGTYSGSPVNRPKGPRFISSVRRLYDSSQMNTKRRDYYAKNSSFLSKNTMMWLYKYHFTLVTSKRPSKTYPSTTSILIYIQELKRRAK